MGQVITDAHEAAQVLAGHVARASHTVFFGGAGVSTASVIPDFRSENGLYRQHFSCKYPPEVLLSHHLWHERPELFYDFYRTMMCTPDARPNQAHLKLAQLEAEDGLDVVITQNIDGLHQKAGSKNVVELHGSTKRNHCMGCGALYDEAWMLATAGVPHCKRCGGVVKPDVVLYEEPLGEGDVRAAVEAISASDLLIIGGTSLVVYPAAGLVRYFRGDAIIIVNLQPTPQDAGADVVCACDIASAFDW